MIPAFHKLFTDLDKDQSGSVLLSELNGIEIVFDGDVFEYFHVDSMFELFDILDVDGSGSLDRDEFVEGLVSLSMAQQRQIPQEQYMLMKLMRIMKRNFNRLDQSLGWMHRKGSIERMPTAGTGLVS